MLFADPPDGDLAARRNCDPGGELRIDVTGIVVRVDEKQRAAVRFTHVSSRELQLIRDLIGVDESESTQAQNRLTKVEDCDPCGAASK